MDEFRFDRNIPNLGALAGRKEATEKSLRNLMIKNSLLCPCGERITIGGVMVYSTQEILAPTDEGMQPGVILITRSFHSEECEVYKNSLNLETETPIAIRKHADVIWIEPYGISNQPIPES